MKSQQFSAISRQRKQMTIDMKLSNDVAVCTILLKLVDQLSFENENCQIPMRGQIDPGLPGSGIVERIFFHSIHQSFNVTEWSARIPAKDHHKSAML